MPHAPLGTAGLAEALAGALTAKTDSCFSSSTLAHFGQIGDWPSRVRYSN